MYRRRIRLIRIGRGPRLCAAAACLVLAIASAAHARQVAVAARTVHVVVAARPLAAGHVLVARDLTVASWPARASPESAFSEPQQVIGGRLASALAVNEAVTATRLLGAGLTTGLRHGVVATSIPLPDARAASLAHAGGSVDVLALPRADLGCSGSADSAGPAIDVADRVLVLAVLPGASQADGSDGSVLVIAADLALARRLLGLESTHVFAVVGDSP